MSTLDGYTLPSGSTSAREAVGTAVVTIGVLVLGASLAMLLQWVDETATLLGLPLVPALGLSLVTMGLGIAGIGIASRAGLVDSRPERTAGLGGVVLFALLGALVGGLLASQLLGLPPLGWVAAALGVGVGAGSLVALPREDLGATLAPAAFLLFVGGVFAAGLLGVGWTWTTAALSVTFVGRVVAPVLAMGAALVGCWSGAAARAGFGARGREAGAFLLVGASVVAMLGTLVLLVGFIVVNGLDTLLTGAGVGIGSATVPAVGIEVPWVVVTLPFVTNVTQSLFVDVPGLMPAILGTLWLVVGAMLLAVPLGVGAAVFLTEYAEQGRFTAVVEVATNGLWSTPSIVFGLFGLAFLVPRISGGKSLLVGQLVLGFMLLPLVLITSRESLKAVPDEYRDASAALGVTRWQTIRGVVLPAAMPGVITGVILGVGRIAGETAPLLLVYGGSPFASTNPNVLGSFALSSQPPFVTNTALTSPGSALPYQLYTSITSGRLPGQGAPFTVLEFGWGTALVLLLVVLGLYGIGIASRIYFRRKLYHD